jgi:hypothetical protein
MYSTKRVHGNAAFYIEVVVLLFFMLLSQTVLVQVFGAAQAAGQQAKILSDSVRLVENAAQTVAASKSQDELPYLLGAERDTECGFVLDYDEDCNLITNTGNSTYRLWLTVESGAQTEPAQVVIQVEYAGLITYSLYTEKYWSV